LGGGLSAAIGGFVGLEMRKQYLAAQDLPLGAIKQEALLCVHKTMLLA